MLRSTFLVALLLAFLLTCTREHEPEIDRTIPPPTALMDMVEMLRDDLEAERHASDGGGRAWLAEDSSLEVAVSQPGQWKVVFETGPEGISDGGWIFLHVPPFWGWSMPQTRNRDLPGFTEVSTDAEGVELRSFAADQHLLAIEVGGRALAPGEQVHIHYGSGAIGAMADRYAERDSPFWIAVDGDGDGIRGLIEEAPRIDVRAGMLSRLELTVESTASKGEEVALTLALLDALGNICELSRPTIEIDLPESLKGPSSVTFGPEDRGSRRISLTTTRAGVYRVLATTSEGIAGQSNPLLVGDDLPSILWGDLHGHSGFSDGTGTPEDYYRYARDVSALDVIALTDHDHWGLPHLDQTPEMWKEIQLQASRFNEPGRFVSLLGYEWTSWIYGHRHVLYFEDEGSILSSMNPLYETPDLLWQALRGEPALTFAHHSAGGPIATDWSFVPDPILEPVTEVVSVHGSSEAADSPSLIYRPIAGNFVRDMIDRGYRLGFIGSGDSHDGHPGLSHLASPTGGLAAFIDSEPTRDSILLTLRQRRVYATNGPRIILIVDLDRSPPGSAVEPNDRAQIKVHVIAADALLSVEIIRSGRIEHSFPGEGMSMSFERVLGKTQPGEAIYVRAIQVDGGAAWSSPFFIDESPP